MQRRQRRQNFQRLQNFFGDAHRRNEVPPAMHDAMPHGGQHVVAKMRFQPTEQGIEQCIVRGLSVSWPTPFDQRVPLAIVCDQMRRKANTFDDAGESAPHWRGLWRCCDFSKGELDARRTGIQGENGARHQVAPAIVVGDERNACAASRRA
jgi:hypothetical protein